MQQENISNHLVKVIISGLWGNEKTIEFNLERDVNFIIGKNGTGKTTVINLIAAVLTADFDKLDKIKFSKIKIILGNKSSRKRPSIEVIKETRRNLPYFDINYIVKNSASEDGKTFDLDALEQEKSFRGGISRMVADRAFREQSMYLKLDLEKLISVNWLSVHRQTDNDKIHDDGRFTIALDSKLTSMNNLIVRFFSRLSSNLQLEARNFQKNSFISLTSIQKEANLRSFLETLDIESEKKSLESIFEILDVDKRQYVKQSETNFNELVKARKNFLANDSLTMHQFLILANAFKTHSLVHLNEEFQNKKKEILEPIDKFLGVINKLFNPQKSVKVSSQNEILITNRAGKKIEIDELSSGEKQLLIILGHALLQEGKPVVFIADEPELSLHIDWQEQLTSSINKINPNAQIIFATHSPDITGKYQENIIDMEDFSL